MQLVTSTIYVLFTLTILFACTFTHASDPVDRILLSNVKALTFRSGVSTVGRRTAPIPQLTCEGINGHPPDSSFPLPTSVQCTNVGTDGQSIQWQCLGDLPDHFWFGKITVSCEGYRSSRDPYILAGSCGLRYELLHRAPLSDAESISKIQSHSGTTTSTTTTQTTEHIVTKPVVVQSVIMSHYDDTFSLFLVFFILLLLIFCCIDSCATQQRNPPSYRSSNESFQRPQPDPVSRQNGNISHPQPVRVYAEQPPVVVIERHTTHPIYPVSTVTSTPTLISTSYPASYPASTPISTTKITSTTTTTSSNVGSTQQDSDSNLKQRKTAIKAGFVSTETR